MESVTRRTVLASATGAAAIGLAGLLFGQEKEKSHDADATGRDCLCLIRIPNCNVANVESRGDGQSRDPFSAILTALAPIIVEQIIKATRDREGVSASARSVSLKELTAAREGQRGVEEGAARSIFSGAIAAPFVNIGVVVG